MEHVVKEALYQHLKANNLISPSQHGFMKGRSTFTNLITCLNDWVGAIDEGDCVDVLYIDIAKAFDTVSHPKLISKLSRYGVAGKCLDWIKAFLSGRRQCVKVNGVTSSWNDVTSGVPQGSVLGPILFLVYINDLPDCVDSGKLTIFADDTKLYFRMKSSDNFDDMQSAIDRVYDWAKSCQLEIALSKCSILHLGSRNPGRVYQFGKRLYLNALA
jgi:hypothetical protein